MPNRSSEVKYKNSFLTKKYRWKVIIAWFIAKIKLEWTELDKNCLEGEKRKNYFSFVQILDFKK